MYATLDWTVLLRTESDASSIETPKNLWVTRSDNMITALGGGVDVPEEVEGLPEMDKGDGKTFKDGGALKGAADMAL